jgi:PBSX family phage terminase large subunit
LIAFEPHSQKQEDAIFSDEKITALITGIQFGKSTVGALWMKRYMHTHVEKDDNFLVVAPTYKILEQATLPAFLKFMEGSGDYRDQKAKFEMAGGGTCYFRTATDPDSVVGITNVRAVWGDEAGKFSKYFWDNVQARASFRDCPIMLTTSPYSLNWIYKELIKERPKHARIIGARSNENPLFPAVEWERRKTTMDPRRFAAIYGGEFLRMQGLVYDCFDESSHLIEPFAIPHGSVYYAGIDWGFTEPFVLHIRAITPSGVHIQVGDFVKSGLTISDIVGICKSHKSIFDIKTFYCDPSQPANILELNRGGCSAVGATNDIRQGIDRHYELIKTGRFKVFRGTSQNTLDEIECYHYPEPTDMGADENAKERLPVQQDDHCMDAMRYCTVMTSEAHRGSMPKVPEERRREDHFDRLARLKRSKRVDYERWS